MFCLVVSCASSIKVEEKVEYKPEEVVLDLSKPYTNIDTNDVYSQVELLAEKLDINPIHLMILINFETGGTFDPQIKSPVSSAQGLIQVVDGTARGLVDRDGNEIKNTKDLIRIYPTIHAQLEVPNEKNKFGGPIFQYFSKLKPKKNDLYDLIACNFYPYARNKEGYKFKHGIRKVNGGIKSVDEYVEMAIKKGKEKGIEVVYSETNED